MKINELAVGDVIVCEFAFDTSEHTVIAVSEDRKAVKVSPKLECQGEWIVEDRRIKALIKKGNGTAEPPRLTWWQRFF